MTVVPNYPKIWRRRTFPNSSRVKVFHWLSISTTRRLRKCLVVKSSPTSSCFCPRKPVIMKSISTVRRKMLKLTRTEFCSSASTRTMKIMAESLNSLGWKRRKSLLLDSSNWPMKWQNTNQQLKFWTVLMTWRPGSRVSWTESWRCAYLIIFFVFFSM